MHDWLRAKREETPKSDSSTSRKQGSSMPFAKMSPKLDRGGAPIPYALSRPGFCRLGLPGRAEPPLFLNPGPNHECHHRGQGDRNGQEY